MTRLQVPSSPAAGTAVSWVKVSKRAECAHCYRDQADAHAAGRPVPGRQRAAVVMVAGESETALCLPHAHKCGYRTDPTQRGGWSS